MLTSLVSSIGGKRIIERYFSQMERSTQAAGVEEGGRGNLMWRRWKYSTYNVTYIESSSSYGPLPHTITLVFHFHDTLIRLTFSSVSFPPSLSLLFQNSPGPMRMWSFLPTPHRTHRRPVSSGCELSSPKW